MRAVCLRIVFLHTVIFGGLVTFVATCVAQPQTPQRPPIGGFGSPPDAMIFYVARGAAAACGPGCSEWIAAEGTVQERAAHLGHGLGIQFLRHVERTRLLAHLVDVSKASGRDPVHDFDVILKERRRLVLVARETPLSQVHLENMLKLARMGVVMLPPMPAFYNHPQTVDDIVDHIVFRVLDQFGIAAPFAKRWDGHMQTAATIATLGGTAAKSAT